MATTDKTPYEILGVTPDMSPWKVRVAYGKKILEHLEKKISPENFRRICRAYETLSDFDKRTRYDSYKEWISDLPIDKYTLQQLAAEPSLINYLKQRLHKATLKTINAQDPITGHTTLYCAARAGNIAAVKFLLDYGAEADLPQRTKSTALHVASFYGHPDVVRYLLESGADYRIINSGNKTAEEEASNNNVKQVFARLKQSPYVRVAADELKWFQENPLTKHVDTEYFAQRQTLLHCACKKGYFNMARFLIEERSANIDLVDFNGNSPLHLAVYGGHRDIVIYLLNRGCDPAQRNRWGTTAEEEGQKYGVSITDLFKSMRSLDMFEMARRGVVWWFTNYFDVTLKDAVDSNGVSLLYFACRYGRQSVANWLLEHGANVNIQITTGSKSTPLHAAKFYGHLSIVELLLAYDADINIKNGYNTTAFDEEISKEVNQDSASRIKRLFQQYKHNLQSEKLLDIHVYEDYNYDEEPIAKIKLSMEANYYDLLEALSHVSGKQYPYFSIARRVLTFSDNDPTVISAIFRARYASSKFIDTPICLTRHQTKPKKIGSQQLNHPKTTINIRDLVDIGKKMYFSLKAPLTEKRTVVVGDLKFTFSAGCIDKNIEFTVTSLFPPDVAMFGLAGCLCLFQTQFMPRAANLIELPTVSLASDPHARLYTLSKSTSNWFTFSTRRVRLPMMDGVHAFIRHVDIIPYKLKLPEDMFLAGAFGQPLITRDYPVRCIYLRLRDQNTSKFPLIAYHGTNINAIQSILLDGLVVPGTVASNGQRIQPPSNHFARDKTFFGVPDYAVAIFLSPSVRYSSDPAYAIPFSNGDRRLIPVVECSVKKDSFKAYPNTLEVYNPEGDEDINAMEWRITDPANIEINGVLFITKMDSIIGAKLDRIASISSPVHAWH